ncbi:MAG: DNA replication/repair protein RecF [Pseudobdellovibrionaceae bacterium]
MILEKIKIHNFRNFVESEAKFSPRLNIFIGENGQGKTNLLEALYLNLQGETFRYGENINLIRSGIEYSLLQAYASQKWLTYEIKTQITKSRKHHFLNNKRVTSADLKKEFSAVVFSPESLSFIKEGADFRRTLIDDLLISFNKQNADLIMEYRKALRTRNRILKNYIKNYEDKRTTIRLIESINPSFLRLGAKLTVARITALQALLKDLNIAMQYISNKDIPIDIEYLLSGQNVLGLGAQEIFSALVKRTEDLHEAELSGGTSLVGPHKHDIVFLYGQKDSRFYCSQGQQRAIILSFKMAQIVYHRKAHDVYPVLMLDDVLSELDQQKRDSLITFLHEINTQIFVTTTDLTLPKSFSLENVAVFKINNGQILQ